MLAVEFPFAPCSRLPESDELFENPVEGCPHGCPAIATTLTGIPCELPTPPEQFNSPSHARRRPSNWLIYTCRREQSKGNECRGKGGVLTPPQSGLQSTVRLAPRAVRRLTDCAGRERGKQLEAFVTAGLKPRPSLFGERNPAYGRQKPGGIREGLSTTNLMFSSVGKRASTEARS